MPKQERSARTRRALILAAAQVFSEEGYVSASLAAVSGRAGLSPGALHFHFTSKQELAQAVDDAAVLAVRQITDSCSQPGAEPSRQLADAAHLLIRELGRSPLLRAGFSLGYGPRAATAGATAREWASWITRTSRCVERRGGFVRGVSAEQAAVLVAATTAGLHVLGHADGYHWGAGHVAALVSVLAPPESEG